MALTLQTQPTTSTFSPFYNSKLTIQSECTTDMKAQAAILSQLFQCVKRSTGFTVLFSCDVNISKGPCAPRWRYCLHQPVQHNQVFLSPIDVIELTW